jgi:hypothetical protein
MSELLRLPMPSFSSTAISFLRSIFLLPVLCFMHNEVCQRFNPENNKRGAPPKNIAPYIPRSFVPSITMKSFSVSIFTHEYASHRYAFSTLSKATPYLEIIIAKKNRIMSNNIEMEPSESRTWLPYHMYLPLTLNTCSCLQTAEVILWQKNRSM